MKLEPQSRMARRKYGAASCEVAVRGKQPGQEVHFGVVSSITSTSLAVLCGLSERSSGQGEVRRK